MDRYRCVSSISSTSKPNHREAKVRDSTSRDMVLHCYVDLGRETGRGHTFCPYTVAAQYRVAICVWLWMHVKLATG